MATLQDATNAMQGLSSSISQAVQVLQSAPAGGGGQAPDTQPLIDQINSAKQTLDSAVAAFQAAHPPAG